MAKVAGSMAGAAVLGAAFLLPSMEYLAQCLGLGLRHARSSLLSDPRLLPFVVDGGLLRWPATADLRKLGLHPVLSGGSYVGGAVLALAAAALGSRRGRAVAMATLGSVLLLCDTPPARLVWSVPPLRWMSPDKLVVMAALGLSLLAGLGIEAAARSRRGWGLAPFGVALTALLLFVEPLLIRGRPSAPDPARWLWLIPSAIVMGIAVLRHSGSTSFLVVLSVLLVERCVALSGFNRWDAPHRLFPQVPVLERLAREAGHERVVAIGRVLSANVATVYGIRDARSYDAIGVFPYDQELLDERNHHWWARLRAPTRSSRLCAASLLVVPKRGPQAIVSQEGTRAAIPELSPGMDPKQLLPPFQGSVKSIDVHFAPIGHRSAAAAIVELSDAGTDEIVWSARLKPSWIPRQGWKRIPVEPPLPVAPDDRLMLSVRAPESRPGESFALSAAERRAGPRLLLYGRPVDLGLAFSMAVEHWHGPVVDSGQGLLVTRDDKALPRARLSRADRDRSAVSFERDDPTEVVLRVSSTAPDTLVLADAFYPGWRAHVDDHRVEIRAEGPRRAVDVPAGVSRITYRYEPWSFRFGLFISAMGLLAGLALARTRHRR